MQQREVVRSLAALAQPLRLELFRALVVAGRRGMTPSVMAGGAGVPPASVSFHLKELMNAGLVTQERVGRNLVYRTSFDHMNELMGYLMANCCEGDETCTAPAAASCNC